SLRKRTGRRGRKIARPFLIRQVSGHVVVHPHRFPASSLARRKRLLIISMSSTHGLRGFRFAFSISRSIIYRPLETARKGGRYDVGIAHQGYLRNGASVDRGRRGRRQKSASRDP